MPVRLPAARLPGVLLALALSTSACWSVSESDVGIAEPAPPPIAIDPPDMAPGAPDRGGDGEAVEVEPHPDPVQGANPVTWDRVSYRRDEGMLQVWWWSGVEPCTVLDGVDVDLVDGEAIVTVFEGAPAEAATISCIAMAVYKTTLVEVDEDLGNVRFVDGSQR